MSNTRKSQWPDRTPTRCRLNAGCGVTRRIRLDIDCADVCATTRRVVRRQTEYDANLTAGVLHACIAACRSCGDECEQHGEHRMEHCAFCARECRRCEEACQVLLDAISV